MPSHRIAASLLLPWFAGCVTYGDQYHVGAADFVLASHTDADGLRVSYSLDVRSSAGDAVLRVETETREVLPCLGVDVEELSGRRAEERGVEPYSGLLVTAVAGDSGAHAAGVEAGDVLLALDDTPTVYATQLQRLEAALRPGQVVTVRLLRGQSRQECALTVRTRERRGSREEAVPLDRAPATLRPYAGVSLRGIPEVWCERIWGDPRQAVVVTSVEVGSPAWLAGVRGGDVVETVDGAPVPAVAELSRRIAAAGAGGGRMRWRLRAADQVHEATIELADYAGEFNVWVPLLFRLQDGAFEDFWSVGPFGLLLANRNHYVADTRTRGVRTTNVFSALFGLLAVASTPQATEVRLLWILRF